MSRVGELVDNNKHGILSIPISRQPKHKIPTKILPWLIWNWMWHVKAKRLSFSLSLATCIVLVGEAVDVAKHHGPRVVLGERSKCLVVSKVDE